MFWNIKRENPKQVLGLNSFKAGVPTFLMYGTVLAIQGVQLASCRFDWGAWNKRPFRDQSFVWGSEREGRHLMRKEWLPGSEFKERVQVGRRRRRRICP